MKVQDTQVKGPQDFSGMCMNGTPCLTQETKALCGILNFWGRRERREACAYLPSPKLQEAEPPGSVTLSLDNMDVIARSANTA